MERSKVGEFICDVAARIARHAKGLPVAGIIAFELKFVYEVPGGKGCKLEKDLNPPWLERLRKR